MTTWVPLYTLIMTTASLGVSPTSNSSSWEIRPEFSLYRYREPGVMRNEGHLYGVNAAYMQWNRSMFTRIEGRYATGKVDYDGSLLNGTPYQIDNIDDHLFDIRILVGKENVDGSIPLRFYTGLGYRYLNDDSSFDISGYERESNYVYLPLGLWSGTELDEGWYASWSAEYDILLYGRQISHMTPTIYNAQTRGFGLRGGFEVGRHLDRLDLGLSPFVRYWWIDDSDVSHGYYEPRNNTLEYGLSLVARF